MVHLAYGSKSMWDDKTKTVLNIVLLIFAIFIFCVDYEMFFEKRRIAYACVILSSIIDLIRIKKRKNRKDTEKDLTNKHAG